MVLESGDVTNAILNTATDLDSDLIVVGHKGTGAIEKFLIGSVAARIGHHADRSVLAIRN
jgi:nucleotide-binding universal stress UspA family protein